MDNSSHAQFAGIRSGASADLYAPMFAGIAARRRELEVRIKTLQPKASEKAQTAAKRQRRSEINILDMEAARRALETTWRVLTSPDVTGAVKRDLLMEIVEKVVCHKDGAEVVYLPGVFGETATEITGHDAEEGANPIVQTTCMVCQVRAGQWSLLLVNPAFK